MMEAVRRWYNGRYQPPENDPSSPVVFVSGWYERHWTARMAHVLVKFWRAEWKWIIGTAITIAGMCLAYTKIH